MFKKAIQIILSEPPDLHYPSYYADLLSEADIPDKNVGKCSEIPNSSDCISRQAAILQLSHNKCGNDENDIAVQHDIETIRKLPPAQPEWNNHTVACLLAELFDDTCACNYNGIDEWLPGKCELLDSCPNPVGVACWEQYLKHRAERRTDGQH